MTILGSRLPPLQQHHLSRRRQVRWPEQVCHERLAVGTDAEMEREMGIGQGSLIGLINSRVDSVRVH